MTCPSCGRRRAKRACPALGADICTICCGTKRLVEIRCPADCPYLASARQHPPAVAQRRHERDARFLWPFVNGLSEAQYRLLLIFETVIRRYRAHAIPPLRDEDVAEAAASLAATLETADRGIIYEHRPTSLTAQRLAGELKTALDELTRAPEGRRSIPRDSAEALRRIERAAKTAAGELGDGDASYLDLVERFLADIGTKSEESRPAASVETPRLIISG
jgi:hypothetical protein